ncbi:type I polyketide synthase [Streptomyces sp. WMMC1477]|uniref:type I polyketide synthase n=1 Tax=Streptomyces sp. WMMC1477 TaxID=3015155 RepID=UPI0022B6A4B5|nr:type I polyketide synthase [Streptomyces sp. WMMC1477]MCZ7431310.1 SDR family NAD(P)-dependent oxidoreductase [Streptomyces sp. WMMC1477]
MSDGPHGNGTTGPAPRVPDRDEVLAVLTEEVAGRLSVPPAEVDPRTPVASFGLKSVDMVGIVGRLETLTGRELPATLVWEYPTIEALAEHLGREQAPARAAAPAPPPARPAGAEPGEPVAVVGVGCRFPGGVDGPAAFWELLLAGRDAVTEVPASRWDVAEHFDPDPATRGRTNSRWGGFVDRFDEFDAHFFGIPPREADGMDPQQRLLAEVAWEALEDAGTPPGRLAGSATGVFVGIANNDYGRPRIQDLDGIDAYTMTGNALSVAANRLSYLLDLRGPSLAVDTACSSSLVAVHQACASLAAGECTAALAGGVNLILSPAPAVNFSKSGAMAADGRCKTFDAAADGYVRAEGVGMVLLKPLSRARADGDRVLAVIRGGAVNQDGRTNGLMAPNPRSQEAMLRDAYRTAGVDPADVGYVEAHGTGTLLGDPIEAKALGAVLGAGRPADEPFLVGSVKSNIGHTEAAAGIAGLIKAVLVLAHRTVPPSLHYREPNPHIPFADLALRVADTTREFPGHAEVATAGVSSFGFGGTNCHLVLQEAPPSAPARPDTSGRARLLTLSARTPEALGELAARYRELLAEPAENLRLADVCHSAALRREAHEHRLACVGSTPDELRAALAAHTAGEPHPGLVDGRIRPGRVHRTAFVFSGQGPRWWPLAAELLENEPIFHDTLDRCDALLRRHVDWSLLDELLAAPDASRLGESDVCQPALCAVQIALATLWRSWGVEPDAVVGHSVGEIAAAHVAGALDLGTALRVALHRGRVIRSATGGRMAVAALSREAAAAWPDRLGLDGVSLAASNGPTSTVFSGDAEGIATLAERLQEAGHFCRVLESVDFASHSAHMDPQHDELLALLDGLVPAPTTLPMVSSVTGETIEGEALDAAYWAANLRRPVEFDRAMTALVDSGHDTAVEISPHPLLGPSVAERMEQRETDGAVVSSLRRDEGGSAALLGALGALHCAGRPVDLTRVGALRGRPTDLPRYPWQRRRHWTEAGPRRGAGAGRGGGHPLLTGHLHAATAPRAHHWAAHVDLESFPYLADHRVRGTVVLPASLTLDAALAAARDLAGDDAVLTDVRLTRAATAAETVHEPNLQLVLTPGDAGSGSFRLYHREAGAEGPEENWELTADGGYGPRPAAPDPAAEGAPVSDGAPAAGGVPLAEARAACPEPVDRAAHYAALRADGLEYGERFQGVESLWRGAGRALARIRPPEDVARDRDRYLLHPALLDSCLHALAAALGGTGEEAGRGTHLPVAVGTFDCPPRPRAPRWAYVETGPAPRPRSGPDGDREGGPDGDRDAEDEGLVTGNVQLYDEDGEPAGRLDGIRLRRLEPAAGTDPVDSALLELGWDTWTPADTPAGPAADAGWWLLLADGGGVAEDLRSRLAIRGTACVTVAPGEHYRHLDDGHFEARPGHPDDLAAVLDAATANRAGRCAGAVHAWGLDLADPDPDPDSAPAGPGPLGAGYDLGCVSALHLVQGLDRLEAAKTPRLVLLTRGAQHLGDEQAPATAAQAPLWGLAKVVAVEHAELRPVVVDLDPDAPVTGVGRVLEEVLRTPGPAQLALRAGTLRTPGLVAHRRPAAEQAAAWRERPFDAAADGNLRILPTRPGVLGSLAATRCERREPGPGEIQIEVGAAGLNFSDVLKAMGTYPGMPPGGAPLGAECAGRVSAVGEGVTPHRPGDRVMLLAESAMAAYATTDARLAAPLPGTLDLAEGAAVPVAFLTALYGLEHLGRLAEGERVLIHAATGGVGLAALQIARRAGAEVFATAGSEAKRDLLRALGVEHVMDSRSLSFADEVMERTGGRGVDVVLNSLSGRALTRSLSLLAPHGRFVEIGKRDLHADSPLGLGALKQGRALLAVDLEWTILHRPELIAELLREVGRGFADGAFSPLPVTEFGYRRAADAFTHMAQARHTGKIVLRPEAEPVLAVPPDASPVRADGTYLITGGLGALGLATARHLVNQGARHLVLTGRGAPSAEAARAVGELRAAGAEVAVRAADVSRYEDVAGLVAEIEAKMPPPAGIFHSAGVLDDGVLRQLDADRMRSVAAPKAEGAWNLHRATLGHELDLFVLYSSAAALVGSAGQGNYAAANAYLDALAWHRRARGLPALSIDWGPWAEIGLAARPDRGGSLDAQGVRSLTPAQGVAALDRLLRGTAAQVSVLPLDLPRLRSAAEGGLLPELLTRLAAGSADADGADGGGGAGRGGGAAAAFREELLATPPGRRRRTRLAGHCRDLAARVLAVDPATVDPGVPLATMGFDSLLSLELRRHLEATLGVGLSATVTWRFPTIDALVPYLAERMDVPLDAPEEPADAPEAPDRTPDAAAPLPDPAAAPPPPGGPETDTETAELDGLADSDIEALLLAKMTQIEEGNAR